MVQASQRFSSGLETLVDKTIKDVLETAEQLNNTRLELDAYRNTLEANPYRVFFKFDIVYTCYSVQITGAEMRS